MSKAEYTAIIDDPMSGYQEMFDAAVDYLEQLEADIQAIEKNTDWQADRIAELEAQIALISAIIYESKHADIDKLEQIEAELDTEATLKHGDRR